METDREISEPGSRSGKNATLPRARAPLWVASGRACVAESPISQRLRSIIACRRAAARRCCTSSACTDRAGGTSRRPTRQPPTGGAAAAVELPQNAAEAEAAATAGCRAIGSTRELVLAAVSAARRLDAPALRQLWLRPPAPDALNVAARHRPGLRCRRGVLRAAAAARGAARVEAGAVREHRDARHLAPRRPLPALAARQLRAARRAVALSGRPRAAPSLPGVERG